MEQHSFGYKDYTKNFRPEKVQMINKVLREKSHCVIFFVDLINQVF